jgi:AcrR family transcriptional regulator
VIDQPGRRERKKALTRKTIADAALALFLEHGYDAVGVREIAAAADVAQTTLFAHFPTKEALAFDQDQDRERALVRAVAERAPGQPVLHALHQAVRSLVLGCADPDQARFWALVDGSEQLRAYESTMWLRHADALAAALAAGLGQVEASPSTRALARFAIETYVLARTAPDPGAAVDEVFDRLAGGWR